MLASVPDHKLPARQTGQIITIQYLRALAATSVLLFHAAGFHAGACGVDIFFVISGFIMVGSASRREWTVKNFALHRIIRIVPLYWLVTMALATAGLVFPFLFRRLHPGVGQILTSLLFIPRLDSNGQAWPLIVPGWSLNLEVLFYVVFAASLVLPRWRTAFLTGVLTALALSSLLVLRDSAWARTYCNPMFLEFLSGAILGKFWLNGKLAGPRLATAMIVGAFLAFAATSFLHINLAVALPREPEWVRVLVWGAPAFALVTGMLSLERLRAIPRSPSLLLLGDASYVLYLIQGLIIAPMSKWMGNYHYLVVPAVLATAVVVHLFVEKPMARQLRSWLPPQRAA